MRVPASLFTEVCQVEARTGDSAYGPVYAAPADHRCMVDDRRKLVRTPTGDETVSETTVYLADLVDVPTESRVTVRGVARRVVATSQHRAHPSLPVTTELALL